MLMYDTRTNHHRRTIRVILGVVALVGVALLGYHTYGERGAVQVRGYLTQTLEKPFVQPTRANQSISFSLPSLPTEKEITKILNNTLPDTCDECDKKPLSCLRRYFIDKRVVRGPGYEYLALDVKTGHIDHPSVYTVMLDLHNNNTLVSQSGTVRKETCRTADNKDTEDTDTGIIQPGTDAIHNAINIP